MPPLVKPCCFIVGVLVMLLGFGINSAFLLPSQGGSAAVAICLFCGIFLWVLGVCAD